ncbi:hypothetical protein B0H11DRAFT_632910 [Mycena galericulata]|nr:hypothetical protein B0H11DRAFT_632910 [Mycena galericulata]
MIPLPAWVRSSQDHGQQSWTSMDPRSTFAAIGNTFSHDTKPNFCSSSTLAFVEALGTMRPFCTVEHVVVWTNGEWYMKIPFGVDEAVATREVSERTDVVEFGADMCITTGEHRGKRLLATRAAGQRAGDVYDRLEELDGSTKKALIIALQRIHDAGWHHHNLHAANTVILDGKVSIIDFGRAQRTSESECTDNCHDYDVSTSINISPSSSTPGTADDEIMN